MGISKIMGPQYINNLNRRVFPWHSHHITLEKLPIKYSIIERTIF